MCATMDVGLSLDWFSLTLVGRSLAAYNDFKLVSTGLSLDVLSLEPRSHIHQLRTLGQRP